MIKYETYTYLFDVLPPFYFEGDCLYAIASRVGDTWLFRPCTRNFVLSQKTKVLDNLCIQDLKFLKKDFFKQVKVSKKQWYKNSKISRICILIPLDLN